LAPEPKIKGYPSAKEIGAREQLLNLFRKCPIDEGEVLSNLGLFIKRQDMARILFMHNLYKIALDVHGVIMEFGVRWGQNLALFECFRGIYEPYNHNRKIIGFDTFSGFPSVHAKDGNSDVARVGAYSVTDNYEKYLEQILSYHEQESPISHIKKFELLKGDGVESLEKYLRDRPETIVALAYFDFDLYEPTKKCLEMIRPHLTRGSVIGFDELNLRDFPGETLALKEAFGLDKYRIRRTPLSPLQSYIVVD
jgi:hypothetical protein